MQRFLRHLCLAMTLLALTGCDDAADREAKYMERGKELYEDGEFVKARLEFRNVLQINPKSAPAMYYLGLLDEENANFRAAAGRYTRAIEQDPKYVPARTQLAQIYVMANDIAKAGEQLDAIFAEDPGNLEGQAIRAGISFRQGELEKAIAESNKVLAEDPGNAAATVIYAQALYKDGRSVEAMKALEESIAKNPKNRNLVRIKIQQHLKSDELDEAETAYLKLVEQWPDDLGSYTELAWFYVDAGRLDDAEGALRSAVSNLPDDDGAKRLLVDFLLNHRGFDAAEQELKTLIENEPEKRAYKFGLATLYLENGRSPEAEAIYRRVIENAGTAPDGLAARAALARMLLSQKRNDQAGALVDEILEADPQNATALLLRGQLLVARNEFDDAILDLRSVLRDDPNSIGALGLLAEAHLRAGQLELAIDALRNLVALDPQNVAAITQLAALNARTGNLAEAKSLIGEALAIAPEQPQVLTQQAFTLIAEGNLDSATRVVRKLLRLPGGEVTGRLLLGRIFAGKNEHEEALEQFRAALELDEDSTAAVSGIVVTLVAMDRTDEAEAILEARLNEKPADAVSYNLLGQVYDLAKRDMEMVGPMYMRAAELSPQWVEPILNHARALIQRERFAEAITVIQNGLERAPSHPDLMVSLAYAYRKLGDIESATATYEKLIERGDERDSVVNNLAALIADFQYEETGRLERAFQLANRFRDSDNPIYLETLGWVNYRMGNYAEARQLIESAIEKGLDAPQVYYHLGMTYAKLGDASLARESLSKAVSGNAEYPGLDTARETLEGL